MMMIVVVVVRTGELRTEAADGDETENGEIRLWKSDSSVSSLIVAD